jgi:hypothetical protein
MNNSINYNYADVILSNLEARGYNKDMIIGYLQGILDGLQRDDSGPVISYLQKVMENTQPTLEQEYKNLTEKEFAVVSKATLDSIRNSDLSTTLLENLEEEDYFKEACRLAKSWGSFKNLIRAYRGVHGEIA